MSDGRVSPKDFKLVVFDIDGTLTRHVSSWQYLHERFKLWDDKAVKYQEMFQAGRISYRKFCRLDAAHWKGMDVEAVYEVFREIPYAKNAEKAVGLLKDRGFQLAALSTGLQFIVERVKKELEFDYVLGNRLRVRNGLLTGGVVVNISHLGKGTVMKRVLKRFGIPASQAVVVGDSVGDIPMMRMAGYAIAFNNSSTSVCEAADYCCRTDDFMEVCGRILDISLPERKEEMDPVSGTNRPS